MAADDAEEAASAQAVASAAEEDGKDWVRHDESLEMVTCHDE